jgi:UDP-N-acetylmuramoyl-L-alanyl-D-glutamate--2,6-diaminopimelate ligase
MTLLLAEIDVIEAAGDPDAVEVARIEHDSRRVMPGDLFVCMAGATTDGHDHVPEAIARGAVGIIAERPVTVPEGIVIARVAPGTARPAMARLAAALHGHPARDVTMIGVTGTNGKTTVAHLLAAVLDHAGLATTVVGTLSGERTTPEATELQALLAEVRDAGRSEGVRRAVVMEVSSHALVQSRVDAVRFDVAIFTNLTHDHLDFHQTMDDYWEAKASLFTPDRATLGVVNVDDPWGRRLFERGGIPMIAVSGADVCDVRVGRRSSSFGWRGQQVVLSLLGAINVENAVLAAEAAIALGVDASVVVEGLRRASVVRGRLETVTVPGAHDVPTVLVDYAHTPDALEKVLVEAVDLADGGRVLVVFGCGGDRDRSKRPLMGAVATRLADVVVVTSDNPRHEDPREIIEQILGGARTDEPSSSLVVEPDRRAAIGLALQAAGPGDVVVLAGKGHETYQEVGDRRLSFDDRAVALEIIGQRQGA